MLDSLNRRAALGVLGGFAATIIPSRAWAISDGTLMKVRAVETAIRQRRESGLAVPADWVAQRAAADSTLLEARIIAFHVVQRVPYKLTSWTGDPDSLFALDRGDCRHKSAATRRLFRLLGYQAAPVQIPFDWRDLPIPSSVMETLPLSAGVHDATEVVIDGTRLIVDPTWDPALGSVGFPYASHWDGRSTTPAVTPAASRIIRVGEIPKGKSVYEYLAIAWPVRADILAFNRAFNAWSDEVRSALGAARG